MNFSDRFWAQVDKNGPIPPHGPALGPCWLWTGRLNRGYGVYSYSKARSGKAHRIAYTELVGPITEGLTLDHLCRVTACVNPDHLEAVTGAENTSRARAAQTHCKRGGHELSGENIYRYLQNGSWHRACKTCAREKQAARRQIMCECGRSFAANNLPAHRLTAVHARAMASQALI